VFHIATFGDGLALKAAVASDAEVKVARFYLELEMLLLVERNMIFTRIISGSCIELMVGSYMLFTIANSVERAYYPSGTAD